MIDYDQARIIAKNRIEEIQNRIGGKLVLLDEKIISFEYGWVFLYTSEEALNGDSRRRLGGNSPFIINKYDGSLMVPGTRRPVEYYIDLYTKFMIDWRS
jgi:hypothetical protein